jgi:hypothetical protein
MNGNALELLILELVELRGSPGTKAQEKAVFEKLGVSQFFGCNQ